MESGRMEADAIAAGIHVRRHVAESPASDCRHMAESAAVDISTASNFDAGYAPFSFFTAGQIESRPLPDGVVKQ